MKAGFYTAYTTKSGLIMKISSMCFKDKDRADFWAEFQSEQDGRAHFVFEVPIS